MKEKIATEARKITKQIEQELYSSHSERAKLENLDFMQGQIDGLLTALRCADEYDAFCALHEETKPIIDKAIDYCMKH